MYSTFRRAPLLLAVGLAAGCTDSSPSDVDAAPQSPVLDANLAADAGPQPDSGVDAGGGVGAPDGGIDQCVDDGPDTESAAAPLGELTDCDSDLRSISGNLDGSEDEDWFRYEGTDTTGCIVDPRLNTLDPARMCIFVTCPGIGGVTCTFSSESAESPEGLQGCCHPERSEPAGIANYNCDGGEDADVYMKIYDGPADQCTSYLAAYHY